MKIVETDKGKFRIAYGASFTERKPEELGKADVWAPETSGLVDYTLTKELVEEKFYKISRKDKPFSTDHRKIFEKTEEGKKPIFLIDITEQELATLLQIDLKYLEPIVGSGLLAILARDFILGEKRLTRREILKKAGAGIYFLSEFPAGIIRGLFGEDFIVGEKSASRAVEKFLDDLNERIHPETNAIIQTLRNSLLAQKAKTIAERLGLEIKGRKPEIALTVGAAHHGIEKALLKEDEERVWLIDKLLSVPGLKNTREKIATIARFDFNKEKDKWELTDQSKDPHLAKIEK